MGKKQLIVFHIKNYKKQSSIVTRKMKDYSKRLKYHKFGKPQPYDFSCRLSPACMKIKFKFIIYRLESMVLSIYTD
ncbi:hypothetical protein BHC56_06020 [Snodgrassella alvi]|nr:hypothetical protein BHC56_06020 [Snodgrassella alvi]